MPAAETVPRTAPLSVTATGAPWAGSRLSWAPAGEPSARTNGKASTARRPRQVRRVMRFLPIFMRASARWAGLQKNQYLIARREHQDIAICDIVIARRPARSASIERCRNRAPAGRAQTADYARGPVAGRRSTIAVACDRVGADLVGADLVSADLVSADLVSADLDQCDRVGGDGAPGERSDVARAAAEILS